MFHEKLLLLKHRYNDTLQSVDYHNILHVACDYFAIAMLAGFLKLLIDQLNYESRLQL